MPSILFVCTGNQYRSPIAAAYLSRLLIERGVEGWQVDSAGTWAVPARPIYPDAAHAASKLGVDVGSHVTRLVDEATLKDHDLILVMEKGQREALNVEFPAVRDRVFLLSDMLDSAPFDVPDPVVSTDDTEVILRDMCDVIRHGLPRIMELGAAHAGGKA